MPYGLSEAASRLLIIGFIRATGGHISLFQGDLPNPGIEPGLSLLHWQAILLLQATWEAHLMLISIANLFSKRLAYLH